MRSFIAAVTMMGLSLVGLEAYGEWAQRSEDTAAQATLTQVNKAVYLYAMDRPLDEAVSLALTETPAKQGVELVYENGELRRSTVDSCWVVTVGAWEPQPRSC